MNVTAGNRLTNWLTAALGAAFVALVVAFVPSPLRLLDLFDTPVELEIHAPAPLKIVAMPPLAAFAGIAARPIFNAGRSPDPDTNTAASAVPVPSAVEGDLSQFRLVGIVVDSVTQRALIERAGAPSLKLSPGDTLAGWRIEKIDATGVVATNAGRTTKMLIPKSQQRSTTH